jgi:hypothetical protein
MHGAVAEKVRMRGYNQAVILFCPLSPTLSRRERG